MRKPHANARAARSRSACLMHGDVTRRVELQNMKIVRPPAAVARYTMVFHKRDSGNAVNRSRSVHVQMGVFEDGSFYPTFEYELKMGTNVYLC